MLAALLPLVATNFVLFQLTLVMVYGLAILGLNLLTGFNGQFSLGHSAFYGIGAYTAAILMDKMGPAVCLDPAVLRARCALSSGSCSACRRCGCRASISRSPPSRSRWRCRRS